MKTFLAIYIAVFALVFLSVFLLSKNEGKAPYIKSVLTAVCVIALVGVVFGMTVLEGRYEMSRLYSSLIAAAAVGGIYIADRLGASFNKNSE